VAHFDVRACRAADVHTDEATRLLSTARDVIVHLDAHAPDRMVRLLRDLSTDGIVQRDQVIALVTGEDSPSALLSRLHELGLSERNVIAERDHSTGARRLILQLSTRRTEELPT
jgi:hypothetical protein